MSRKQRITQKIHDELHPNLLEVEDESNQHNVPAAAETHFKVTIISDKFEGLSKIARHRLINNLLAQELLTGLHALSLHLHTPEEWQSRNGSTPNSPTCLGGYHHG